MNVAITVWGNRISPVFDSAKTLLVAEIREEMVVDRKIHLLQATIFNVCLRLLAELEVRVLLCGALCEGPLRLLESQRIEVIPFLTGETEQILQCFVQGEDLKQFVMPGCGHSRCCRMRKVGRRDKGIGRELEVIASDSKGKFAGERGKRKTTL